MSDETSERLDKGSWQIERELRARAEKAEAERADLLGRLERAEAKLAMLTEAAQVACDESDRHEPAVRLLHRALSASDADITAFVERMKRAAYDEMLTELACRCGLGEQAAPMSESLAATRAAARAEGRAEEREQQDVLCDDARVEGDAAGFQRGVEACREEAAKWAADRGLSRSELVRTIRSITVEDVAEARTPTATRVEGPPAKSELPGAARGAGSKNTDPRPRGEPGTDHGRSPSPLPEAASDLLAWAVRLAQILSTKENGGAFWNPRKHEVEDALDRVGLPPLPEAAWGEVEAAVRRALRHAANWKDEAKRRGAEWEGLDIYLNEQAAAVTRTLAEAGRATR